MINDPSRRPYQRPQPPDMHEDGTPQPVALRASRARQGSRPSIADERITEPGISSSPSHHRRGPLAWMLRGLLAHWVPLALGALLIVGLWMGWQDVLHPWLSSVGETWQYGDARLFQTDRNVGHDGTSHFIAEYYKGYVFIVEFPDGNAKQVHVYSLKLVGVPVSGAHPLVTLTFADVNHDGLLDMEIQVEGDPFGYVLYNNGTTFQPTLPQEQDA